MVATRTKPGANYEQLLLEDTREEKDRLIPIVKARTGPGSGFRIKGTTGIEPICAYIASERLGNNDFSEEAARKASCLQSKVFKETLQTIELVLAAYEQEKREKQKVSYDALVAQHKFNREDFMVSCMRRAELVLVQSGKLGRNLKLPNDMITVAVFVWMCRLLKRQRKVDQDALMEQYDIDQDEIFEVYEALDRSCQRLSRDITAEVQAMRDGQPTDSGATSPTKRSVSRSPSKPFLRDPSASLTRTPTHKRKAVFAAVQAEVDAMEVDETPVKKPRTSPRKSKDDLERNAFSAFQAALCTPSRPDGGLRSALKASSSKMTLDLLASAAQRDDSDDEHAGVEDDALSEVANAPTTDAEMADATTAEETEPGDASEANDMEALEPAELATPRRPGRIPRPIFEAAAQTPKTPRRAKGKTSPKKAKAREPIEDEPPRRRHRPVLLGHWQWFRPDVRVVPTAA
ncbi:hypothetical protein PsYK624_155580 [Phanerochaete sordida]|uniref:Uncharacterized protein n=1 Tax=Phanerochaete sordida TaxID=48140 RepID=A0A9P3GTD7_9APHY|nr:hypothetical protein PsYK624_155580 [Phanerochaete sordida]